MEDITRRVNSLSKEGERRENENTWCLEGIMNQRRFQRQLNWKRGLLQRALNGRQIPSVTAGIMGITEWGVTKLELGIDFHFLRRQLGLQTGEWTGKRRDNRPVNKWQVLQKRLVTGRDYQRENSFSLHSRGI